MLEYRYYISITYKNGDESKDIKPENIAQLHCTSEFEGQNMPQIYGVFHLDRNFIDDIIKNASTAYFILNIQKVLESDETETKIPTEFCGDCVYLVNSDINYNKEIDYAGDNATKEDIYREIHIGMMFKNIIEYNKQNSNGIIVDTAMMNAVTSLFGETPLLIENFKYNEVIDQLVVPPQETLSKAIQFFNNIKVFYDTQYRFFIDPTCAYLISSSGKAVQRADEKYNSIIFKIHGVDDPDMLIPGMEEDDANKCYTIDINVKDTNYQIDNDTCKVVNTLQAIINPSKDNSFLSSTSLKKIMSDVQGKFDSLNSSIKSQVNAIKAMPGSMRNYKIDITDNSNKVKEYGDKFSSLTDSCITEINALPTEQPVNPDGTPATTTLPVMDAATKQAKISQIKTWLAAMQTSIANFINIKSLMKSSTSGTLGTMAAVTNLPSIINSISVVNAYDNKNTLATMKTAASSLCSSNISDITSNLIPTASYGDDAAALAQNIQTEAAALSADPILLQISQDMATVISGIKTETSSAKSTLDSYKKLPDILGGILKDISSPVNSIKNLSVNIREEITSYKSNLGNYISTLKSQSANLVSAFTSATDSAGANGLSLASLSSIKSNINSISDISKIGTLGANSIDVDLSLKDDGTGSNIIAVGNDNANYIKNIKSSIENKVNRFTLNKVGLDCSIFTINKQYTIKNYDAHSDKDGTFILTRKILMWFRQDDKFVLSTMLEFNKVAESSNTADSKEATKTSDQSSDTVTTQDIDAVIAKGKSIISNVSSNGLSIDTIQSIASEATTINEDYNKMQTVNSAKTVLDKTTTTN